MLLKAILVGLVYFVFQLDFLGGTTHISRPIVLGAITGLVMGDLQAGIIIGANLELVYMGVVSIGLAALPDYVSGTILGTALAIQTGAGPEAALALGIPVATAMMLFDAVKTPVSLVFVHMCDRAAEKADPKLFKIIFYVAPIILSLMSCALISIGFYLGSDTVTALINRIPTTVQNGMNIALGIIPAIGFVLLLRQMAGKKNIAFYFMGFFIVKLFGFSPVTVAIIAILIAWLIVANHAETVTENVKGGELDEF
ncbi:MAG: PTS sugar transporter subunit IIC [Herbinix sp.]|nr:PTS sugar transporter subunit IIC [Herbinix sp.]